jgi:hypothetical protein
VKREAMARDLLLVYPIGGTIAVDAAIAAAS